MSAFTMDGHAGDVAPQTEAPTDVSEPKRLGKVPYSIIALMNLTALVLGLSLFAPAFPLAPPMLVGCLIAIVRVVRSSPLLLPSNLIAHGLLGFSVLGRLLYEFYISVPDTIANKLLQFEPTRLQDTVWTFSLAALIFGSIQLFHPGSPKGKRRPSVSALEAIGHRIEAVDLWRAATLFIAVNALFWVAYTPSGLLDRSEYIPDVYVAKPLIVFASMAYLPIGLVLAWRLADAGWRSSASAIGLVAFLLAAMTTFAMGARDLAFLPLLLAAGTGLDRSRSLFNVSKRIVLGVALAALIYPIPLHMRTLDRHGLFPFGESLMSEPMKAYETQTAFSVQTLLVGFPLTIETEERTADNWSYLLTSAVNPMPGRFTDYEKAERELQLVRFSDTAAFPLNGLGLLVAGGPLVFSLCCALSGVLLDWLYRSGRSSPIAGFVQIGAIGIAGLFVMGLVQYGPRLAARALLLAVFLRLAVMAYFITLGRQRGRSESDPALLKIDLRDRVNLDLAQAASSSESYTDAPSGVDAASQAP